METEDLLEGLRRVGHWRQRIAALDEALALIALLEVGVFARLVSGPMSLADLAESTNVAPQRLRAFVDVACAVGFLQKAGESVRLLPGDERVFDPRSPLQACLWPRKLRAHLEGRSRAVDALSTDAPLPSPYVRGDTAERQAMLTSLDAIARLPALEVAAYVCSEGFERVVDLGCGAGTYALAALRAMPDARAVFVDFADAAPIVEEALREAQLAGRGTFVAADLREGWPDAVFGAEVVLMCHLLPCLSDTEAQRALRLAWQALSAGGRLYVSDLVPTTDPSQRSAALACAQTLAMFSSGRLRPRALLCDWTLDAGFDSVEECTLGLSADSLLIARKGS